MTREDIAKKFGTTIAKKYVNLGNTLVYLYTTPEEIIKCINEGADVNFSSSTSSPLGTITPLSIAIGKQKVDLIKLLLDSGANPYFKDFFKYKTAFDVILKRIERAYEQRNKFYKLQNMEEVKRLEDNFQELEAIKTLLENAMKK